MREVTDAESRMPWWIASIPYFESNGNLPRPPPPGSRPRPPPVSCPIPPPGAPPFISTTRKDGFPTKDGIHIEKPATGGPGISEQQFLELQSTLKNAFDRITFLEQKDRDGGNMRGVLDLNTMFEANGDLNIDFIDEQKAPIETLYPCETQASQNTHVLPKDLEDTDQCREDQERPQKRARKPGPDLCTPWKALPETTQVGDEKKKYDPLTRVNLIMVEHEDSVENKLEDVLPPQKKFIERNVSAVKFSMPLLKDKPR